MVAADAEHPQPTRQHFSRVALTAQIDEVLSARERGRSTVRHMQRQCSLADAGRSFDDDNRWTVVPPTRQPSIQRRPDTHSTDIVSRCDRQLTARPARRGMVHPDALSRALRPSQTPIFVD
jgi:hypothetical protein